MMPLRMATQEIYQSTQLEDLSIKEVDQQTSRIFKTILKLWQCYHLLLYIHQFLFQFANFLRSVKPPSTEVLETVDTSARSRATASPSQVMGSHEPTYHGRGMAQATGKPLGWGKR